MAPRVVHVHIGSSKTGTTFVQQILWSNKAKLAANGVLLPGKNRRQVGDAARALNKSSSTSVASLPDAWHALASEVLSTEHRSAVVSQEFLCWLTPSLIQQVLSSLAGVQVKVVLTTRDLARLIPAQWQTAMRQGNTWTLTEYSHAVAGLSKRQTEHPAFKHFWVRQDYGEILTKWVDAVGADNVTVVTLPASSADPDELWRRFCSATDLDPDAYATAGVRNTSLGAISAEVLRRVNDTDVVRQMPHRDYAKEINGRLTRHVLDPLRKGEPGLTLPDEQRAWVASRAEQVIAAIQATGVQIEGTLDDLRPRAVTEPYVAPELLPVEDLLATAIAGLAGLAAEYVKEAASKAPGGGTGPGPKRAKRGSGK
ncbi:MAG: hypothetical protein ABI720_00700 [Actinomycetes bacterium]